MKNLYQFKKILTINLDNEKGEYADFVPYVHNKENPLIYVSERKIEVSFFSGTYACIEAKVVDKLSISWEEGEYLRFINTFFERDSVCVSSNMVLGKENEMSITQHMAETQMRMLETEGINNRMAQDMTLDLFHKLIPKEFKEKYMPGSTRYIDEIKEKHNGTPKCD
jgi:hypothetical protein